MSKKKRVGKAIKGVVTIMMDRVMNNVLINDPFIKKNTIRLNLFTQH